MRLRNELTVDAALEETWAAVLDLPRVASALPGATIEPGAAGDVRGRMRVKIGPVTVEYAGAAHLEEVDEDEHVAAFRVHGSGGQGTATATIATRLEPAGEGRTRVVVETDLRVTGRAASFGRGLMEDVAARMLGQFATRLGAEIAAPRPAPGAAAPGAAAPAAERVPEPGAFDAGAAAWEPLVRQYAVPALLLAIVLLLLRRPKVVVIRER